MKFHATPTCRSENKKAHRFPTVGLFLLSGSDYVLQRIMPRRPHRLRRLSVPIKGKASGGVV
jgi:hypothetical protein